jgi:hypothetical protein
MPRETISVKHKEQPHGTQETNQVDRPQGEQAQALQDQAKQAQGERDRRRERVTIKTSFTGTRLTGQDAQRFLQQIEEPPNPRAAESVARGVAMAREMRETGRVVIRLEPNPRSAVNETGG